MSCRCNWRCGRQVGCQSSVSMICMPPGRNSTGLPRGMTVSASNASMRAMSSVHEWSGGIRPVQRRRCSSGRHMVISLSPLIADASCRSRWIRHQTRRCSGRVLTVLAGCGQDFEVERSPWRYRHSPCFKRGFNCPAARPSSRRKGTVKTPFVAVLRLRANTGASCRHESISPRTLKRSGIVRSALPALSLDGDY